MMNAVRKEIYQYLLQGIAEGRYGVDDRIPTEQELGEMFSTHRMDAHYAVKTLEQHGILRRRRKHGTFVSRVPAPFALGELKSLTTRRICVLNTVSPEYQHIHWNQRLIKPLEDGLHEAHIDVRFEDVSALKTLSAYRRFLADQIASGVNAILLIPQKNDDGNPISQRPELLFEFHNNVFIFDRGVHDWNSWPYNTVSINVFGEGVLVADHLIGRDIQHVIFVHRRGLTAPWLAERMNGLRYGLCRQDRKMMSLPLDSPKPNAEFFREVRRQLARGATALVAQNDEWAASLVDAAREQDLPVGDDLAIIGFDDNSRYASYNLTTVSPSLERIGQHLAALICNSLEKPDQRDVTCTRIHSELKVRATG